MTKGQGFGPTGKFPHGRLNEHDEGELRFGIAADPDAEIVILNFGTPVSSLGMPPDLAIKLAMSLIRNAQKLTNEVVTIQLPVGELDVPVRGDEEGDRP